MTNTELGNLIRDARKARGLTQADLAAAVDQSRHWVIEVERGSYYGGRALNVKTSALVHTAAVLGLNPQELLSAAGVEPKNWPDLSHFHSNGTALQTLDITGLSDHQVDLVRQLVNELQGMNLSNESGRNQG